MNIDHLNEFIYLADSLSFRRTAEHFYVSRSVISRHLNALEKSLGAVLLERTAKGVQLTEAGKVFLQEAQTIVRDWNLARTRVQAVSGAANKLVRVGYLRNGARPFLARFVRSMAQHNPEVRLSLLCMGYHEARQAMEEGSIDVMLGINVDKALSRNYRSTFIYEDRFVAVCRCAHPLAQGSDAVMLDALRDQKCLVPDSYVAAGLAPIVNELVDEGALSESEGLYDDMDLLYLKIQTEECVAFVSSLNAAMFEGSLVILPVEGPDMSFTVSAYYHHGFAGTAFELCKAEFEECQRFLASSTPDIPRIDHAMR